MKKLSVIFLIVALSFCLFACGGNDETPDDGGDAFTGTGVIIELDDGREIRLELFPDMAPITVSNFLNLVNNKHYDNTVFHRVIAGFMIQTGDIAYTENGFSSLKATPAIHGEFLENDENTKNTLKHTEGTISMARGDSFDSASAQFFICSDTTASLDGKYAAFGRTMDDRSLAIVKEISKIPTGSLTILSRTFENFPCSNTGSSTNSARIIRIKTIKKIETE